MAKTPATKRDPKWQSAQPQVVKFEKVGDAFEGIYTSLEPAVFDDRGKQTMGARYYFSAPDGPKMVWGSAVIDNAMKFVVVGSEVRIEFAGEGEKKPGQSAVKLFNVFHVPPEPTEDDETPF